MAIRIHTLTWMVVVALCQVVLSAGCATELELPNDQRIDSVSQALVPGKGAADTLDVASWNLEWFGDPGNGPSDDNLQRENAYDVISGANMDIWGVAEIVSASQFATLKSQLGYAGLLANESSVVNGPAYYSDFNNAEQKVGLLYKRSLASVLDARVILTANDDDFAGRPPLQITLRVTLNGTTEDIIVIVMHAKCCSDTASWQRRQNASNALKSYLDASFPTQKVFVIGDFNDDLDTSITPQHASPYANFLSDTARYAFVTKALSDAHIATTVDFPDTIDQHLESNESKASYIAGSVEAYRVDQYITNYGSTTSDHYPVLSRYTWPSSGATVTLTAPNGGESWVGGSVHNVTWTAAGVATLRIEYSLNAGGAWTTITSNASAAAGSYSWTLPATASNSALVRVSDSAGSAADTSNATFSITGGAPAQLTINEICANEPGSDTAGEFVEIVNIGGSSASLGGYTLSDGSSVRHTFAAGTTLASGQAIVVFGGAAAIPAGLTNAVGASSGGLNLANAGDSVTLKNASAVTIQSFTYSSSLASTDGVSMNRNPDGSASGTFVKHDTISSLPRSAGTRANGAAW